MDGQAFKELKESIANLRQICPRWRELANEMRRRNNPPNDNVVEGIGRDMEAELQQMERILAGLGG